MTIQEYLKNLLISQEIKPGSAEMQVLHSHKDEITKFLRKEFGNDPVIKYAGSYEKGTMIQESYDLDIVCYFPSTDLRTLKEIHDDVVDRLKERYVVEEKASAARILNLKDGTSPNDYHVDVVPGRFIEGSSDVFLHVAYGEKERIQTNLNVHIGYIIKNSDCTDIIKLVKLWNHRNNLTIKTFILEIFVVRALKGFQGKTNLKSAFFKVIQSFRDEFGLVELQDPANPTGNIISKLISPSHRILVVQAAKETFAKIEKSDQVELWKKVFRDDNGSNILQGPTPIKNPPGQWAL